MLVRIGFTGLPDNLPDRLSFLSIAPQSALEKLDVSIATIRELGLLRAEWDHAFERRCGVLFTKRHAHTSCIPKRV
jgi:hypothetical protein